MRVVSESLKRLVRNKDVVIEKGLEQMLEDAVLYALRSHDENHRMHIEMGDSYGWVILHDGEAVRHKVTEGKGQPAGNAYASMMRIAREVARPGWIGIVVAGMNSSKPLYFEVDYEMGILYETIDHTEKKAISYFKPIIAG